jgi:hypothetical protein
MLAPDPTRRLFGRTLGDAELKAESLECRAEAAFTTL